MLTLVTSALGNVKVGELTGVQALHVLQSQFRTSLGYKVRAYLRKKINKINKKDDVESESHMAGHMRAYFSSPPGRGGSGVGVIV